MAKKKKNPIMTDEMKALFKKLNEIVEKGDVTLLWNNEFEITYLDAETGTIGYMEDESDESCMELSDTNVESPEDLIAKWIEFQDVKTLTPAQVKKLLED